MPKITQVPAQPTPKQLTARAPVRTLLEHHLAFLNAHNKKGFLTEGLSDDQAQTIFNEIERLSQEPQVAVKALQAFVLSTRLQQPVQHPTARKFAGQDCAVSRNMLARLFGYKNWQAVEYYKTHDGMLLNRRNTLIPLSERFRKGDKALVKAPSKKELKEQLKKFPKTAEGTTAGSPPLGRFSGGEVYPLTSPMARLRHAEYFARRQQLFEGMNDEELEEFKARFKGPIALRADELDKMYASFLNGRHPDYIANDPSELSNEESLAHMERVLRAAVDPGVFRKHIYATRTNLLWRPASPDDSQR